MHGRRSLVCLLIVALTGLSGCLDDAGTEEGGPGRPQDGDVIQEVDSSSSTGKAADGGAADGGAADGGAADGSATSPSGNGSGPATGDPADPARSDRVDIQLDATHTRGTAPFEVRFFLDAADVADQDLSWTFDADGDGRREAHGDQLPVNLTHVYPAGTWEVTFKVTTRNGTTAATETIQVAKRPITTPPPPITIEDDVTGVWIQGVGYLPDDDNHTFALDRPVKRITASLVFEGTAVDLDLELYAPDGRRVAREAHYNEPTGRAPAPFTGPHEPAIEVAGKDAASTGEWTLRVMPALAVQGDYTVTIRFA